MDFQGEIKMNKLQALLIAGLLSLSSVSFATYQGVSTTAGTSPGIQFDATKTLSYDVVMADGYDGLITTFGSSTNGPDQALAGVSLYNAADTTFSNLLAGGSLISSFNYLLDATQAYIIVLTESDSLSFSNSSLQISSVPVPAAGILFASALLGAGAFGRRKKKAQATVVGAFARVS